MTDINNDETHINLPRICTPTESYEEFYPKLIEFADKQLEDQLWFHSEMEVELDRMQLLYELTPSQQHAVKYILGLFLRYELIVGCDFWREVVPKVFPRPEVERMASVFSMVELAVHAPFYNKINKVLGLDKEKDYLAYKDDKELKHRVDWLHKILKGKDKILACAIFSMTETALLFSMFALLKSFQSNGLNKAPVVVRGTNQSALDEDLHGQGAAELVNIYYSELGEKLIDDIPRYEKIKEAVLHAEAHECRVVDNAIPEGHLNGHSAEEYKNFVRLRLNIFLERLQLPPMFVIDECSVADWFEKNTYSYKSIDFFTTGVGNEYEMGWDETRFGKCWGNK